MKREGSVSNEERWGKTAHFQSVKEKKKNRVHAGHGVTRRKPSFHVVRVMNSGSVVLGGGESQL